MLLEMLSLELLLRSTITGVATPDYFNRSCNSGVSGMELQLQNIFEGVATPDNLQGSCNSGLHSLELVWSCNSRLQSPELQRWSDFSRVTFSGAFASKE